MSARRALLFVVVGVLLGAVVVDPAPSDVRPVPRQFNYRLMHPGPPVKS